MVSTQLTFIFTRSEIPYNVGSVLWRLFSTLEVIRYIGGGGGGGNISTVRGLASVLWRLLSTVGNSFSNVGDSFSTVEVFSTVGR